MANRGLTLLAGLGCWLGFAVLALEPAAAQCKLCAPAAAAAAAKPPRTAITIQVETKIDFAMIALATANQGGTARIDPATGQRILSGGLISLTGIPVTGTVVVRGEPKGMVTVSFPNSVSIYNSAGASYPLSSFTTTLKPNPKLGDDGTLRFTFGGLLRIDGSATGTFRGSIPVTVDYK